MWPPSPRAWGLISEVFAIRIGLAFTPPKEVGPTGILGVEIPAGISHGPIFFRPSTHSRAKLHDATVELDVGVEIRTDLGRRGAPFTDGTSFFVSATMDGETEPKWPNARANWKGAEELVALSRDPR